jgi:hypothetical protein
LLDAAKTWMPGTSSAKTRFALLAGHDEKVSATDFSPTGIIPDSDDGVENTPAAPRRAAYSLGKTLLLWAKHFPLN